MPTDFAQMELRLGQEMGRCAKEYDEAREAQALHHGKMEAEEATLVDRLTALRPTLDAYYAGKDADPKAIAEAQQVMARLDAVRSAKRMAYTATLPPGENALNQPLGDAP